MRILEGVGTVTQLAGLMARLCKLVRNRSVAFRSAADPSVYLYSEHET